MMLGNGNSKNSQDFDLNLAPVIDCLTVLIAFMLASATFLSIGILDAGIAAAGNTATDVTPPPVNIAIELSAGEKVVVKLSGKSNQSYPISRKGEGWDYDSLSALLKDIKTRWPGVNAATLIADNSVQYKDVVKAMEVIRKDLPAVLLGGF